VEMVPLSELTDDSSVYSDLHHNHKENEAAGVVPLDKPLHKRRITPGGIALLVVGLCLLVGIVFLSGKVIDLLSQEEQLILVPSVQGEDEEIARSILAEYDLVASVTYRYSNTYAYGTVISQSPDADTEVSSGRLVELVVSQGEEKIIVPDVIGSTQRIAVLRLEEMGLKAQISTAYDSTDSTKGQVIDQYPVGGANVDDGVTVEIVISQGLAPVISLMPNVVGMDETEAVSRLKENGLTVGEIVPETSYEYSAGVVMEQSIPGGSDVTENTVVNLVVSAGPGPEAAATFTLEYYVDPLLFILDTPRSVVITIEDVLGTREVYNKEVPGGTTIQQEVTVYAPGEVIVTVDGQKAHVEVLE